MPVAAKSSIAFLLAIVLVIAVTAARAQPPVTALAFAPGDTQLVAGSQSGIEVRCWPQLQTLVKQQVELRNVHDLSFSPDGEHLLIVGGAASEFGEWQIVAWPSLEVVARQIAHNDSIHSAAWLANNRFVTVGGDNNCIVWILNGKTAERVAKLASHSRSVLAVEALPEHDLFVTAGVDQMLRVWSAKMDDSESSQSLRNLDNHTGSVCDLALRPGQQPLPMLASASVDKTVRLWQPTIGRLVKFARVPVEPTCLAWSRDGSRLATGCADGKLRIINPTTVQFDQTCEGMEGWIHSVAAANDGTFVVGGTGGQITRIAPFAE
jgi:WD40 repeat protein